MTNQVQLDAFGNPIVGNNVYAVQSKQDKQDRPRAKYWLNIGLMLPNPNKEGELQFVQVAGCGIGMDTANRPEIKGTKEFQQLLTAQNVLLDNLIKKCSELEVGTSVVLPHQEGTFCVQLTHADSRSQEERKSDNVSDNPYLAKINQIKL